MMQNNNKKKWRKLNKFRKYITFYGQNGLGLESQLQTSHETYQKKIVNEYVLSAQTNSNNLHIKKTKIKMIIVSRKYAEK